MWLHRAALRSAGRPSTAHVAQPTRTKPPTTCSAPAEQSGPQDAPRSQLYAGWKRALRTGQHRLHTATPLAGVSVTRPVSLQRSSQAQASQSPGWLAGQAAGRKRASGMPCLGAPPGSWEAVPDSGSIARPNAHHCQLVLGAAPNQRAVAPAAGRKEGHRPCLEAWPSRGQPPGGSDTCGDLTAQHCSRLVQNPQHQPAPRQPATARSGLNIQIAMPKAAKGPAGRATGSRRAPAVRPAHSSS